MKLKQVKVDIIVVGSGVGADEEVMAEGIYPQFDRFMMLNTF